jgi:hypothetical protein
MTAAARSGIAGTRAALADAVRLAALRSTNLQTPFRMEGLRPIVRLASRVASRGYLQCIYHSRMESIVSRPISTPCSCNYVGH